MIEVSAEESSNNQNGIRQRPQQKQQQQPAEFPHQTTSTTTNNNTMRRRTRWRLPEDLTAAQETVFLNMQLRKMNRALTGTKSRNKTYELVALAVLLIFIYSVGSQTKETEDGEPVDINDDTFVSLTLAEVITIGVWLYVAVFVTEMFKESKFIELLYWMFIYVPLVAVMVSFVFGEQASNELGYLRDHLCFGGNIVRGHLCWYILPLSKNVKLGMVSTQAQSSILLEGERCGRLDHDVQKAQEFETEEAYLQIRRREER